MRPVYKVVTWDNKSIIHVHKGGKYVLEYLKNKIVKAKEGTLGIFCFEQKKYAENFIDDSFIRVKIIKVLPIGRGISPDNICEIFSYDRYCIKNLNDFYKNKNNFADIIPGTICYPSVKVLE